MEAIIKQILKKENINAKMIKKATSGFTNIVYFADGFVIKIATDEYTKNKLEKEISIYKNIKINNIPNYISSGTINDYTYLIISKVNGVGLYSIWHTLSYEQRVNCVKQIAKILKEFNKQNAEFLSDEYKMTDWAENIKNKLKNVSNGLKKLTLDTKKLDRFINYKVNNYFGENNFGLVYNDSHFDNFIYDNGKLSLIDFDRVVYAPIDYEMLIFKTMCDNPSKFASEEDEDKIIDSDYSNVYDSFKLYYKEMFNVANVEERIKIYQFIYLADQAINMKNRQIGNSWAKELLVDFIKDFCIS